MTNRNHPHSSPNSKYCLILTTCNNQKTKQNIINKLLIESKLSACIQTKEIESHYLWNNQIQNDKEYLITIKTTKNLYNSKAAYCGDRARYIDKALRYLGYTTRYASLYHNDEKRGFVSTLLTRTSYESSESHALIEVKTSKGWMIVDTRHKWISLTQANQPISLEELKDKELAYFQWNNRNKEEAWPLLDKNYYIIYELYSRHGQFYAPYTRYIPDINWFGFMRHNILKF